MFISFYQAYSCAPAWLQRDGGLAFLKQAAQIRTKAPPLFEGLFWRHAASKSTPRRAETAAVWKQTKQDSSDGVFQYVGRVRAAANVKLWGCCRFRPLPWCFWARACKNNSVSWRLTSPLPQTAKINVNPHDWIMGSKRLNTVIRMEHVSFC